MAPPLTDRALTSATRPLHLAPLAIGALAGGGLLAIGLAPLAVAAGALSVTTWGALVALDLANPPPPPPAPPLTRFGRGLQAIERAARRVTDRIATEDGTLGATLLEVQGGVESLIDQARALAARGDQVDGFLAGQDLAALEREIDERRAAAGRARDPAASASLRAAAEARAQQLGTFRELANVHDRLIAELVSVEAALGELEARIVRLQVHDPTEPAPTLDATAEIRDIRERMGILERSATKTLQEVR